MQVITIIFTLLITITLITTELLCLDTPQRYLTGGKILGKGKYINKHLSPSPSPRPRRGNRLPLLAVLLLKTSKKLKEQKLLILPPRPVDGGRGKGFQFIVYCFVLSSQACHCFIASCQSEPSLAGAAAA